MNTRHCKRARWHDYYAPSIYFITLNKRHEISAFGSLIGDCNAPEGSKDYPSVRKSFLGLAVKRMIYRLPEIIPSCRLYQYMIMPDHIHLLIHIEERTPFHLGSYISKFKNLLNIMMGMRIFESGFNDKIIGRSRSLNVIYKYMQENPYRLAVRRANRCFFERCDRIRLDGKRYMAYGNLQILKNPFMEAVIIHRCYGEKEVANLKERWLRLAESGGVLVSPFIAAKEKEIRREIEEKGGAVVLIVEKPFEGDRYKPFKRDFDQCAKGELVILAPAEEDWSEGREKIPRKGCLTMNKLAEYLVKRGERKRKENGS